MGRRVAVGRLAFVGGAVLIVLVGIGLGTGKLGPRPECPESGMWSTVFAKKPGGTTRPEITGQVVAAQEATDIPEFHDCQQFIVMGRPVGWWLPWVSKKEEPRFLSLFAVFARFRMDTLLNVDSVRDNPSDTAVFLAEVYAYDKPYPYLGIKRDFNCLFLRGKGGGEFSAVMVPVGREDKDCPSVRVPNGTDLEVKKVTMPGAAFSDYPPVARWDWDAVNRRQYIGVKCGTAWCEIHGAPESGFASSPSFTSPGATIVHDRRVVEIKGWYDRQQLALPALPGLRPAVGSMVGTLIPDPDLGRDLTPQESNGDPFAKFDTGFAKVATVAIEPAPGVYAERLSLYKSVMPEHLNALSLCVAPNGGAGNCFADAALVPKCDSPVVPTWYVRSDFPSKPSTYRCVIRREHKNFYIPGVVRWRWEAADETYWIRCNDGCCEVRPGV